MAVTPSGDLEPQHLAEALPSAQVQRRINRVAFAACQLMTAAVEAGAGQQAAEPVRAVCIGCQHPALCRGDVVRCDGGKVRG